MITLQVKNAINICPTAPRISEYTGAVLDNPSWLGVNHMCLSTGEKDFPFRVIRKSDIVSSSVPVKYNKPDTDKNVFQVKNSKGDIYTITRNLSSWSCTCIGYGFRNTCKHIVAAKKLLDKAA